MKSTLNNNNAFVNKHSLKFYLHFQKQLTLKTPYSCTQKQMQQEYSQSYEVQQKDQFSQKDHFKQCFTKYISSSKNSANKNKQLGNFAAPIELSSDDSDQLSDQQNYEDKGQSNNPKKPSSQTVFEPNLKPKTKFKKNISRRTIKQSFQQNKKQNQGFEKMNKNFNPQNPDIKSRKQMSFQRNQRICQERQPFFELDSEPYKWPSSNQILNEDKPLIKSGYPLNHPSSLPKKKYNSRMKTTKTINLIYIPPSSERRQISESKRFMNRRLTKQDKIDLGVYSLQQVVTFAYNQNLINKLLYYEFNSNYNGSKQSQFVDCFVNEQIEKWDFKNNKIVLADHRRLTYLLINVKPSSYKINNPQALDCHVSEFLKGLYDLSEEKYTRMMDYIDKLSNNIWWLPIKIKHFGTYILDNSNSTNPALINQKNNKKQYLNCQDYSDEAVLQNNQQQIKRTQTSDPRKPLTFKIDKDSSNESESIKNPFQSYVQKIAKSSKLIRKFQTYQNEKSKNYIQNNFLKNHKKNQKRKKQKPNLSLYITYLQIYSVQDLSF